MTVYYNEFDKQTAAWLRVLIAKGHIAPGVVDERSIEDVRPSDLDGFTQCHFFAGIGVWSYALRRAGWRDDRPIWTGSCPCQPFSAAGKGAGFDDERHLWPHFQWLIQERKPAIVLGEQVASAAVDDWIDLVHADLETLGYAFGSVPFPSAGVGAPHIRDRNYWVAQSSSQRRQRGKGAAHGGFANRDDAGRLESHDGATGADETCVRLANPARPGPQCECGNRGEPARCAEGCGARGMGNTSSQGLDERERERGILGGTSGTIKGEASIRAGIHTGGLADYELQQRPDGQSRIGDVDATPGRDESSTEIAGLRSDLRAGPTNSYWRDADWLGCRDGRWRPVEPGTFPLVTGASARVVSSSDSGVPLNAASGEARIMRLRGYGNAINAEAAKAFISVVMEVLDGR